MNTATTRAARREPVETARADAACGEPVESVEGARRPRRQSAMSYKFQRLREKLRAAIRSGDLSGKLPGERSLARRFHVNAKTLSKALTDLAAEGVLDRSIGRGTYVRGIESDAATIAGKWLILCDPGQENSCIARHLREACPRLQTAAAPEALRPSFLNRFTAVLDLAADTPEAFLRDLLVRGLAVVAVNREPRTFSMHSVSVDVALGVSRLARDLLLAGHRKLAALDPRGSDMIAHGLRQAASRYASDATLEACEPSEAAAAVSAGATALVCGSVRDARQVRAALAARNIQTPGQVSLTAVGCACPEAACSGYFVECRRIADAVAGLLRDAHGRPVNLWLPGQWLDRGTLAPVVTDLPLEQSPPLRVSGVVV